MSWLTAMAAAAVFQAAPVQNPPAKTDAPPAKAEESAYDKAIKDYKASSGVFKVFRKDESLLLEIPKETMGRDILWYVELKESPAGGFSGAAVTGRVVRFEVRGERILMRDIDHSIKVSGGKEIQEAVRKANVAPIITTFDIRAKSPNGSPLIDVTRLFKVELPELPVTRAAGGQGIDPSRSFLEKVNVFPENLNVEVTLTMRGVGGFSIFGPAPGQTPSVTAVFHHSLIALPKDQMMPRLADSRVGYFTNPYIDYGTKTHGVKQFDYINRFRLEKKDKNADLSEPVKPITFYIGREVPKEWHACMIKAVEDWNVAFEAAGFKNAIKCRPAPTVEEDPNWSEEDIRYSTIRWAPLPIANAMGPSVPDPRTGEILSAHIIMWHDVLKLGSQWYFAQASPNDPRAQRLPLPQPLMEEILGFVVSHEVGHTLGLPHNGKASAMVPIKNLRDPKWTAENGTAMSIMDYARFNYVAQPGDGAGLMAKIGKYDKFSIMWGYKPIDGARTPEDEVRTLDAWAARQVGDPTLRFYDNFNSIDPTAQAEALGDDAMEASRLGMLNLQRVMGYLLPATSKLGEDYTELGETHGAVVSQYRRYIGHVVSNLGGLVQTDFRAGRGGMVWKPVPKADQKRAVRWMNDWVLNPPQWLYPRDLMLRVGPSAGLANLQGFQGQGLNAMLDPDRLNRLVENRALNGAEAYSVEELLTDLRGMVWKDLSAEKLSLSPIRRSLHRAYVNATLNLLPRTSTEVRAYTLDDLIQQHKAITAALPKAADSVTRIHLQDLARAIKLAVDNPVLNAAVGLPGGRPFLKEDELFDHDGCGICAAKRKRIGR